MSSFDTLGDGTYTIIVDGIDDEIARIFIEKDGEEIGDLTVPADTIPEEGRQPDAILHIEITDGNLTSIEYDPAETETRKSAAQNRFDNLSERPPSAEDQN